MAQPNHQHVQSCRSPEPASLASLAPLLAVSNPADALEITLGKDAIVEGQQGWALKGYQAGPQQVAWGWYKGYAFGGADRADR